MPHKDAEERKSYAKKHYQENRAMYRKASREAQGRYRRRNRRFLDKYKMLCGCKECGFKEHPAALEFHHLSPEGKDRNVASLANTNSSLARLKDEIRKCVVLCANHHRMLHVGELCVYAEEENDVA